MASTLFFYSKSADKKPGEGANEFIMGDDEFEELAKIQNWRHVLSNFYEMRYGLVSR